MSGLILLLIGLFVGYWFGRNTAPKPEPTKSYHRPKTYTYEQRQRMKVIYQSDAERIRELNTLSSNDSIFLRILKQEFHPKEIVVKQKRYFVVDRDHFPIAIFEYRDGTQVFRNKDFEDGLPLFMYKGLLSSDAIKEDAEEIQQNLQKKPKGFLNKSDKVES